MFWTCPRCQTENSEYSKYCHTCGERKVGEKPLKTTSAPPHWVSTTSRPAIKQYLSEAEQSFDNHLRPIDLSALDHCSAYCKINSYIYYFLGVLAFLGAIFNIDDGRPLFFIIALVLLNTGFVFQVISEVIYLFLHGHESWFLTAKYSYVNSHLLHELIKKLDKKEETSQDSSQD